MGKVTQTNNNDTGAQARQNWNEALKDVAFTDFESGVVLDDDTMATATDETLATSESIAAYVNAQIAAQVSATTVTKSYSIGKVPVGTHYLAGFYRAPAADANLTQASTSVTYGGALIAHGAHAFVVVGGAGTVDTGVVGLQVSGTRVQDDGTRTAAYTETIIPDITAVATDEYYEGAKFIGTVTYSLITISGSPTTYSLDFNYGLAKYEDFGNVQFQAEYFEFVAECNTADTGFNIELLKHEATGWTYHATAFVPGDTVICDMNTDYVTEINTASNRSFAYKRTNLHTLVDGTASEGVIVRITQGSNNTLEDADCHIGVLFTDTLIT